MVDAHDLASLDADMIERVLAAIENGASAEADALARILPFAPGTIERALGALHDYNHLLQHARTDSPTRNLDDERLPDGTVLGDYVIEAELGRGAMGIVYRARQRSLGDRPVALKVLAMSLATRDPRFLERFRREASLAAAIHHPNLAEVYGVGPADGSLCFAMRLIEGRTLHEVHIHLSRRYSGPVRRTSATHVRHCVELVRALADALAEIHARGLVHRDVKPANIMLEHADADPEKALTARPVLVDFGLLRPTGGTELTGTGTLLGTPAYASPESQLGRDVDVRADVFSLGATLHDLLTVTSPGSRGTATAGLPDVRAVNPEVDRQLGAIVEMALQERPALRYENGGAFRDDLDRYLRGESLRALPTSSFGRFRQWAKRDPLRAVRTSAAVVLAAVLFLVVGWFGSTVWRLHRAASDAATLEREGDLLAAARSHQELLAHDVVLGFLPWLATAREHALPFVDRAKPLGEARQHLDAGVQHLNSPNATTGTTGEDAFLEAEREFALGHTRLRETLFHAYLSPWHEAVQRFIFREVRTTPNPREEFRRRLALDTWSNYLMLQEKHPRLPHDLREPLRMALRELAVGEGRRSLPPATWQAAVAAYGAIREISVFRDLLLLFEEKQNLEIAHLARNCTISLWTWFHVHDTETYNRIDAKLIEEWARRTIAAARFHDEQPLMSIKSWFSPQLEGRNRWDDVAQQIAWREANPEEKRRRPPIPAISLNGLDLGELREPVDAAKEMIASVWPAHESKVEQAACYPLDGTPISIYRRISGREHSHAYDRGIWEPAAPTRGQIRNVIDDAKSLSGELVVFTPDSGRSVPALLGSARSAEWSGATIMDWERSSETLAPPRFLCMTQPGRSELRICSQVPPEATGLVVEVDHLAANRAVLRGGGTVVFRLRIQGTSFEFVSEAPKGSTPSVVRIPINWQVFAGAEQITLVLDYVRGDTSYRVKGIRLDWNPK